MNGFEFGVADAIQIAILYFAIYAILKAARGTRFGQVLTGVGLLFALLLTFTYVFNFDVIRRIVQGLLLYLIVSPVVIFQPEIRRILATMGSLLFQRNRETVLKEMTRNPQDILIDAIFRLSEKRRGALLAVERGISLRAYESSGIALDALISTELILSIFREPEPLHDGGVIIRNGRIAAAHCLFPVSSRTDLISYGMRHRAAVGITEETDSFVIAVSEESGAISIAHNGHIVRYPIANYAARTAIMRRLRKIITVKKTAFEILLEWLRKHAEKNISDDTTAEGNEQ